MRHHRVVPLLASLTLLCAVRSASADTIVTGTVGRAFSGDLEEGHTSYGAAIGFMGEGVLGFEVEGTYTPHFFGETPGGTNNVTTLMGNLVLGVPLGESARIYATAAWAS